MVTTSLIFHFQNNNFVKFFALEKKKNTFAANMAYYEKNKY